MLGRLAQLTRACVLWPLESAEDIGVLESGEVVIVLSESIVDPLCKPSTPEEVQTMRITKCLTQYGVGWIRYNFDKNLL